MGVERFVHVSSLGVVSLKAREPIGEDAPVVARVRVDGPQAATVARQVGDDAFFAFSRAWVERHDGGTASTSPGIGLDWNRYRTVAPSGTKSVSLNQPCVPSNPI